MKVPDEAIIAELRTKLGNAESYIVELEEALKNDNLVSLRNENKSLRGNIKVLSEKLKRAQADEDDSVKIRKLKSENRQLVNNIIELKRKAGLL